METIKYLDELYDKYKHQAQQALEDWDYQDFDPDKRCALLSEEVTNNVKDDLVVTIKEIPEHEKQTAWFGESADAMLADYDCGTNVSKDSSLTYEAKMLIMSTPPGGVQGIPEPEIMQRFLVKALTMNPQLLIQAIELRLGQRQNTWQIRCKVLAIMNALIQSPQHEQVYLGLFLQSAKLAELINSIWHQDYNSTTREMARKTLSLLRSNGKQDTLLEPLPSPRRSRTPRGASSSSSRKEAAVRDHSKRVSSDPVARVTTSVKSSTIRGVSAASASSTAQAPRDSSDKQPPFNSKVAQAAYASWKRRSQKNLHNEADTPNLMPFQNSFAQVPLQQSVMLPPPPSPSSPRVDTTSYMPIQPSPTRQSAAPNGSPQVKRLSISGLASSFTIQNQTSSTPVYLSSS